MFSTKEVIRNICKGSNYQLLMKDYAAAYNAMLIRCLLINWFIS